MTTSQRRVLTIPCMACNREPGQPLCELCDDLESAEERAQDHDEPRGSGDDGYDRD